MQTKLNYSRAAGQEQQEGVLVLYEVLFKRTFPGDLTATTGLQTLSSPTKRQDQFSQFTTELTCVCYFHKD